MYVFRVDVKQASSRLHRTSVYNVTGSQTSSATITRQYTFTEAAQAMVYNVCKCF